MLKKILIKIAAVFLFLLSFSFVNAQDKISVYVFYGQTCPHCEKELEYLDSIKDKENIDIKKYEVYYDTDNQELMKTFEKAYNANFTGVPVVIIGKDYFLGESKEKTDELISKYSQNMGEYIDAYQYVLQQGNNNGGGLVNNADKKASIKIFNKEIKLESVGPVIFGILLGFADGINPCMFGVLIFLLTYLISIGSKKRVLKSGLIFAATAFVFYFTVMFLMHKLIFSTTALLPYISIIKIIIGIIALVMGSIEIKDFFFYGKGVSLKIPEKFKPTLEKVTKQGTYFSAFLLAILSSLVELPCTIGIPLAYIGAIDKKMNIFIALLIYNIFFITPVLIIVFSMYFSFSKYKNGEGEVTANNINNKKIMRLIAGIILCLMGLLFILGKI